VTDEPSERLLATLKRVGVSLNGLEWDASKRPPGTVSGRKQSDIAHEMAHRALATPWRRERAHYGLGAPWDPRPGTNALNEEALASILGVLIDRECGGDHVWHLRDHGWLDGWIQPCASALRILHRAGYIERGRRGYVWTRRHRAKGERLRKVDL